MFPGPLAFMASAPEQVRAVNTEKPQHWKPLGLSGAKEF